MLSNNEELQMSHVKQKCDVAEAWSMVSDVFGLYVSEDRTLWSIHDVLYADAEHCGVVEMSGHLVRKTLAHKGEGWRLVELPAALNSTAVDVEDRGIGDPDMSPVWEKQGHDLAQQLRRQRQDPSARRG